MTLVIFPNRKNQKRKTKVLTISKFQSPSRHTQIKENVEVCPVPKEKERKGTLVVFPNQKKPKDQN